MSELPAIKEKGKRGRKPGTGFPKGDAKPKERKERQSLTITDKLLNPYSVESDGLSFTLMKEGESKPIGYFTDFGSLISKVVKLKTAGSAKQLSLIEFLNEYKQITNEFKDALKQVLN